MSKKFAVSQERSLHSKGIVTGAIIGGTLGVVVGFLNNIGFLGRFVFAAIPAGTTIIATLFGIFIGGGIGYIIELYILRGKTSEFNSYLSADKISDNNAKIELREEVLDISKKWIQTGEVTMHNEVVTEEKNIIVPVTREELVIEKKVLGVEGSSGNTETIRIPIKEERIEVIKHSVVLEDVEVYKRQFQENERVNETLKKEKVHLETTGEPVVIDKDRE